MSLLLGSILSATDPVAVVAVLKTLGAPKKLASLIEGESLLNDGSAFVLFLIFKDMAAGHEQSFGSIVLTFSQLSLGGPLFGIVCAWVAYFILYFVCTFRGAVCRVPVCRGRGPRARVLRVLCAQAHPVPRVLRRGSQTTTRSWRSPAWLSPCLASSSCRS